MVPWSNGQSEKKKERKQKAVRLFFLKLASHSGIALIRLEVSRQTNTISPFWDPPKNEKQEKDPI